MDFVWLGRYISMHQAENQTFSYPFAIEINPDTKVVAWFWYDMSGTMESQWFTHIKRIYVANENQEVSQFDVVLDVPATQYECKVAMLKDYLKSLEQVYSDFSEEKMNVLIQEQAYKPLFKAFQCVKDYVKAKYK